MAKTLTPDEQKKLTMQALDELTDDERLRYAKLLNGYAKLADKLPEACTPDNEVLIGELIERGKKAEKYAGEQFTLITQERKDFIERQRLLWKPLVEKFQALWQKAQSLADALLDQKRREKEQQEAAARQRVLDEQQKLRDAEARALAAQTPEESQKATAEAETAWQNTRSAVAELNSAPVQTSVRVGNTTVYESKRLDFEITDMGSFAKAHPELVEIRRGPTLAALKEALQGQPTMPETLPGWPGLRLKMTTGRTSRSGGGEK